MLEIQFINWKKYQARQGVKPSENASWLRFENRIINHDIWHCLSNEEFKCFIWLLCRASLNKNSGKFIITETLIDQWKIGKDVITRTVNKLKTLDICEVKMLHESNTDVTAMLRDCNPTKLNYTKLNYKEFNKLNSSCSEPEQVRISEPTVIQEFFSLKEIFTERGVTEKLQRAWIEAYPDPAWIVHEVQKAAAWEVANPQKRKKHFGRFIGSWLSRGWDKSRTRLPSNKPAEANYMANKVKKEMGIK